MAHKTKATIGSVSSGTMRMEDLIPDFAYVLGQLCPKRGDHRKLVNEANRLMDKVSAETSLDILDDETLDHSQSILEELFEALNEYAPPYCHFGSHDGDGADYGFWPSLDSLEDDCRYGQVLKVNDTSEIPSRYRGLACLVNDHGNVTLYRANGRGKLQEVWSIV